MPGEDTADEINTDYRQCGSQQDTCDELNEHTMQTPECKDRLNFPIPTLLYSSASNVSKLHFFWRSMMFSLMQTDAGSCVNNCELARPNFSCK